MITPGDASLTFLDVTHELWSSTKGDPRAVNAENVDGVAPLTWKEKLNGKLSWPFSLAIPSDVRIKVGRAYNVYKAPGSFMERGANVTVLYRLKATVNRGVFLASGRSVFSGCHRFVEVHLFHSVDTTIVYVPRIRPEPPSPMMQLAFQERHPLVGPKGDPEGWHSLDSINIRGTLFSTRDIGVRCVVRIYVYSGFSSIEFFFHSFR